MLFRDLDSGRDEGKHTFRSKEVELDEREIKKKRINLRCSVNWLRVRLLTKIDSNLICSAIFASVSHIEANSYMGRSRGPLNHCPLYPIVKHKPFVPRQSCLHRQAAIALYRALLIQCRASPVEQEDKVSLQHIVRNRFHANRDKISSRLLKLHFHAGYKALNHLDGAVANDALSISTIKTYLSQTPQHLKDPRPPPPPPREIPEDHYPPPPEHRFLANFPRPHVEGIRKVPFFVPAQITPFVRYKKPQPYTLGRTIRQINLQKQIRMDFKEVLEDYYQPLASYEDAWDKIINREFERKDEDKATFAGPVQACWKEVNLMLGERDTKALNLAKKQWDIVVKEKELAIKERDERRRIAWEKRQERYRLEGRFSSEAKVTRSV